MQVLPTCSCTLVVFYDFYCEGYYSKCQCATTDKTNGLVYEAIASAAYLPMYSGGLFYDFYCEGCTKCHCVTTDDANGLVCEAFFYKNYHCADIFIICQYSE